MKSIDVVAAVIKNKVSDILIARRRKGKSLEGYWEFPGGKVEKNESHSIALHRELREEFSIQTEVGDFISSNEHDYGTVKINLHAYYVHYMSGDFLLVDHDKIEWVPLRRIAEYKLAPADIPILSYLIENDE